MVSTKLILAASVWLTLFTFGYITIWVTWFYKSWLLKHVSTEVLKTSSKKIFCLTLIAFPPLVLIGIGMFVASMVLESNDTNNTTI